MISNEDVLSEAIQNNAMLGRIGLSLPEPNFDRIAKEWATYTAIYTTFIFCCS